MWIQRVGANGIAPKDWFALCVAMVVLTWAAGFPSPVISQDTELSTPNNAGNEDVARIMREFEGRGDLGDGSPALSPAESLQTFVVPEGLQIELIAAEPDVAQPLQLSFDPQGRLWVVQYRQYPFPAGLKVVRYDQHLRAVFDKTPVAPPNHTRGADRITVLEDQDGDGSYETVRDVITGLNIATSVVADGETIWVMNPPYLLAYPDHDQDAVVDGDPVVHLSGFGLEDTHSVANSLKIGPDGWLYGVNGSTTTARVRNHVGKQPVVAYEGQCVWRYHPVDHYFEIYAEGGGNPFGLEIDEHGQVFSGTNWGNTRGMHYVQGAYGVKNWGKHGPLTNPHAYGFFNHMPFQGDGRRFTEEFVLYDDTVFPERFQGQLLAVNPLQHVALASRIDRVGSTYSTTDVESLITTSDQWFRPVDIALGPDGALYFADWYDTRLTHVDPRDNWHKSSGRIYRISPDTKNQNASEAVWDAMLPSRTRFDLTKMSDDTLLDLLNHPNRELRFLVIQVLSRRRTPDLDRQLSSILIDESDPRQLESLWLQYQRQGPPCLWENLSRWSAMLHSADADVRRWAVRLLGDRVRVAEVPASLLDSLVELVKRERDVQVRSQLASTAKRLPAGMGVEMVRVMLQQDLQEDREDPHIPLLLWWAVEGHLDNGAEVVLKMVDADEPIWNSQLFRQTILPRLPRRCVSDENAQTFVIAENMLRNAPSASLKKAVYRSIDQGLADSPDQTLPDPFAAILAEVAGESEFASLMLNLKQNKSGAIEDAIAALKSSEFTTNERIELIGQLADARAAKAIPVLTSGLRDSSVAVRRASLAAISRFDEAAIGSSIVSAYQSSMDSATQLRPQAVRVLVSRVSWAKQLIREIDALRIPRELVTHDMLLQLVSHNDPQLTSDVERLWGRVKATNEEKQAIIRRMTEAVRLTGVNLARGKKLFTEHCGKCHRLFGEGGEVGPDLTGYERTNFDFLRLAIADPSAAIREEYTNYQVLTKDGQQLSGILVDRGDRFVSLKTAEGELLRVAAEEIEVLQASDVSIMPENTLEPFTPEQLRDLLHYVASDRGQVVLE